MDLGRTSSKADEAPLARATVAAGFGQVYDQAIQGQAYGQPLAWNGAVLVATEADELYSFNVTTGAPTWAAVNLGTPEPSSAMTCNDINPSLGTTATPVIDPVTGILYVTARTWNGSNAAWVMHAIDTATGTEVQGWPARITGAASNDPTVTFNPDLHNQRPGLLLLDGQVFAGFGSYCDLGAYRGWIAAVTTGTAKVTMWTTETGAGAQGAIWQAGGGPASDRDQSLLVSTGNGSIPPSGPATTTTGQLAMSVVRLTIQADGSLAVADRWTPCSAAADSSRDQDLGSGSPVVLPATFGPPGRHLLLVGGKTGRLYVLDRDNLGGYSPCRTNGSDPNAVSEARVTHSILSHPALWQGDGGYIYLSAGGIQAYTMSASGVLALAGSTSDVFPFGAGSPLVTSDNNQSGTGVVWEIVPSENGGSAELRAYDPVPAGGTLQAFWHASLPSWVKFTSPAADGNRVFVATDGHLLAFGPSGPTPQWSSWSGFTGAITGNPAAIRNQDGRLEYFWRQPDGSIGHNWQTAPGSATWSGGAVLGGAAASDPAAGVNADGRLEVFMEGSDGRVWHDWQTPASASGWSGWAVLGGSSAGVVSVGTNSDSRLEVFAPHADHSIWHSWQTPSSASGWSPWAPLGGNLTTPGAAARNADGRLELFAGGADGATWHTYQDQSSASGWSGWSPLGGSATTVPTPILDANHRLQLFTRSATGAILQSNQDPARASGWTAWLNLAGNFPGRPLAALSSDGDLELFTAGGDGALWHNWQWGSGLANAWNSLGGSSLGDPAPVANSDGRLEVFTHAANNSVQHAWQLAANGGV